MNPQSREERPYHQHRGMWADEFRKGAAYENWRSRGTPDWLLILTVSGKGRVGTTDGGLVSSAGTVTLYEAGTPQNYLTDPETGKWHLLWAHFHPRPDWMPWLQWPERAKGLRAVELDNTMIVRAVRAALRDCVKYCRQRFPGNEELALNALERAILWIHSENRNHTLDPRVRRATELLLEEMSEPFSLELLARKCGLSVSRLAHLFSEQIGSSPQHYLESLRLRRASHLLRSSELSISQIAADTGYANAFYFSNRFKKAFGASPSDFRGLT